jgi:hypothetical protein
MAFRLNFSSRALHETGEAQEWYESGTPLGAPLLFYPPRQIFNLRPKNQQVVYFAQMDLRYDLETIWRLREAELENETIVFKLILPVGSEEITNEYLIGKGLSRTFILPDEQIAI